MKITQVPIAELSLPHWSDQERENAHVIAEFIQRLMNDHDFEAVQEAYGDHRYLQHNLTMADGMSGVLSTIREVAARFPDYQYDVKTILSTGDMVVFHSHVTTKAAERGDDRRGLLITDRWRVVDGEIVEHWDAIQPLSPLFRFVAWLTGGAVRNSNPRF